MVKKSSYFHPSHKRKKIDSKINMTSTRRPKSRGEQKRVRFEPESDDEIPPPPPEEKQEITPSPTFTNQDCFSVISEDLSRLLVLYETFRLLWGNRNFNDLQQLKQDISKYVHGSTDYKNAVSISRTILWNNLNDELSFLIRARSAKLESEWEYLVDIYEALGRKFKFSPLYTRKAQENRKKIARKSAQEVHEYNSTLEKEIQNLRGLVATHLKKLL